MFIFLLSHCSLEIPKKINQEMAGLPEEVDFNYHIKPILSDRCFKCHGPDENTRKAGLRLDVETLAFAKLASGKSAFSKGSIYRSEAAHRIISMDPEIQMPPPFSNLQLTEREKAMLLKWIEQGAKWKEHWSFTPSKKINASLLSIKNNKQIIDQFISDKLTENGLSLTLSADAARPDSGDLGRLSADNVTVQIKTKAETLVVMSSQSGVLDVGADRAQLTGGVSVNSSSGYTIETEALYSSLNSLHIETDGEVRGAGPVGSFQAGKMILTSGNKDKALHLLFTNGVILTSKQTE